MNNTLDDYLRVCEAAVRTGGRIVQDWVGKFDVRKKGPADLVTQADLASQEAIRGAIAGAFPGHSFLGEEHDRHAAASAPDRAEYRWIVDPLDGTTNFVHGVPHYSVSLALERNGQLLVGAVYNPVLDECYTASRGHGARLNGRTMRTSGVSQLPDALAAVGFPPHPLIDTPDVSMFLSMLNRCQAIRRTGSTALNLCYLAAGRFDVYWSYSARVWDVAAGILMVEEAGGCVTSPTGGAFCLDEAQFLAAANAPLHAQLREVAAAVVQGGP